MPIQAVSSILIPANAVTAKEVVPLQQLAAGNIVTSDETRSVQDWINYINGLFQSNAYVDTLTGNDVTTDFYVNHLLDSQNIVIQVYANLPGHKELLIISTSLLNDTTAVIKFDTPPAVSESYTVICLRADLLISAIGEGLSSGSGVLDILFNGNSIVTNNIGVLNLSASNIPANSGSTDIQAVLDGLSSKVTDVLVDSYTTVTDGIASITLQPLLDEINREWRYNAIYEQDSTIRSAPVGQVRNHNWHLDIDEPLNANHQYSRYLFGDAEAALRDVIGTPNLSEAVGHLVINQKHVYVEYLAGGLVNTVIDITDASGNVLQNVFRPVPLSSTWFFGQVQSVNEFPTGDTIRSIVDINVPTLYLMTGSSFDLETNHKQLVSAINEVNSRIGEVDIYEAEDETDAINWSMNNANKIAFVAK